MTEDITAVARAISEAESTVAFTGAGISTASGIPDFRSEGGIWDRYDPSEFHYSKFKADPAAFWEKRLELYDEIYGEEIRPNSAHEALAALEEAGHLDTVITQNVDGLHAAAGSSVIEIHGNGQRVACESCDRTAPLDTAREQIENGTLPPECPDCGGVLKPDVVLFGEQLPRVALQQAKRLARDADVLLAVGSSLTVEPAASLPRIATRKGATLAIVNLEETPVSERAEFDIRGDVANVLPAIRDAVESV
ncbi:NAD-dependent protein deacylase [Halovenus sp. WSH3]|uniref:NAD-dependent protein deacylase n=1 Tax=Halovenus carboxidivorans TaxID=2692199 RepID=A0A6B0T2X8_9EURY|nr:NAD-dependent deacylase [Halovenus carboxidivorans]MXR52365.1 NAD-dependent protein deacylase [Halovenus carboxidivorans]